MLELVDTAALIVVSADGCTLWTRGTATWPELQDSDFPLRILVHPEVRTQSHLPDVLNVEATGLGGRDLGYPAPWDISFAE